MVELVICFHLVPSFVFLYFLYKSTTIFIVTLSTLAHFMPGYMHADNLKASIDCFILSSPFCNIFPKHTDRETQYEVFLWI